MKLVVLMFGMFAAAAPPDAKLAYHARLENAARMPIAVSPDGKRMVYFVERERDGDGYGSDTLKFSYAVANIDGTDQRIFFETPVDWDESLNCVVHDAIFSPDGKSIAAAATDNGHSLRGRDDPGRMVPAICNSEGKALTVACKLGSTGGFGFARDGFVFLDTHGLSSGEGYRLSLVRDGKTSVLASDEQLAAHSLRVSPDGRRVVFFVSEHVLSSIVRMRMFDLVTGETKDSPEFKSQQATFGGRPQLFFRADGEGVLCHVSIHERSKWPFELTAYDFRTGRGRVLTSKRNVGASAVLDEDHVALWHPDGGGGAVLRMSDQRIFMLPEHNYILGGRGRNVVVADLERDSIYAATLALPHAIGVPSHPDDH